MGPSPAEDHGKQSPVSPTVLMDLARELGADATARFVRAFVDLWPVRRLRIHTAIQARDAPAAMDAVLSLRSAALMAGAQPLADQAELIRGTLSTPGPPAWNVDQHLLAALDDLGDRTVQTLYAAIAGSPQYGEYGPGQPPADAGWLRQDSHQPENTPAPEPPPAAVIN
jgi:hypothetical protein